MPDAAPGGHCCYKTGTAAMVQKSVLTNSVFNMAGQLLARLLALGFYAVFARVLGPERNGDQGFGAAVGTVCVVLLEPGLNMLLVRDAARDRASLPTLLAQALGYKLTLLLVVWPVSVGLCLLLGTPASVVWAVAFAGGTVLLGAVEDLAAAALSALERLDLEGALRVASKALTAGLGLLALWLHGGFEVTLGAVTAGAVAAAGVGLWMVARTGVAVTVQLAPVVMARRIGLAWPLAVHNLLWLLTLRLDQLLASAMGQPHEALGAYNAAVKTVEALLLFPSAVALAFQARVARASVVGDDAASAQLTLACAALLAVSIPVTAGGGLLAGPLAVLIFGERFGATGPLLAIQLLALPLVGIQALGAYTAVAAGRTRLQALATAVNLVANVVLNLVLVPRLGMLGASVAAVVGGAVACVVYVGGLWRLRLGVALLAGAWRPLVAAGAMVGGLWLLGLETLPLLVTVAAGAVLYAAVFVALGGLGVVKALAQARRE